jgi:hypothetical protein
MSPGLFTPRLREHGGDLNTSPKCRTGAQSTSSRNQAKDRGSSSPLRWIVYLQIMDPTEAETYEASM